MIKFLLIRRICGRDVLGILCLISMVLMMGCGKKEQTMPMGGMTINVIAFECKRQPILEKVSLVGSLAASESIEIKNEMDGTIEAIDFMEGEHVDKGKVLFRINQEKLQATLAEAEANLGLAETTAERYKALIGSRAVSQQEYDQAVAELAANRATVILTKEELNDATIEAPFVGIMGERLVSMGQFITKGTSLSFLVKNDPMIVELHVPERFLSKIQVGQKIQVGVAAYADESFTGEVYFIDPKINERTRTVLVKAFMSNPEGKLHAGMFANLDLIFDVRKDAVAVPESALIINGDTVSVFVIDEDDSVTPRSIKSGIRFDGMVEVVNGLEDGEKVVTEGHQKLRAGAKVNAKFDRQNTIE